VSESIQMAASWEAADGGYYELAALHALRAADFMAVRTTEGAAVWVAMAQVYATLALATKGGES